MLVFYGEELLAPYRTLKLENHPLSAVHNFLFSIFTATLHIQTLSPPPAIRGCAISWWHRTHLHVQTCFWRGNKWEWHTRHSNVQMWFSML